MYFSHPLLLLVFQQTSPNQISTNIQTKFNQTPPCHVLSYPYTSISIPTNNSKQFSHTYSNKVQPNTTMSCTFISFYFNKYSNKLQTTFPQILNRTPPCPVRSYPFTSISIPTKNTKQQSHKYSNKVQPNPTMSCTFISLHFNLYSNKQFQNEFQQIPTNFNQTPPCHVLLIPFYLNKYCNTKCQTNFPQIFQQTSTTPHHVMYFSYSYTSTCIPTKNVKQNSTNRVQSNPTMSCTFISFYFNKYSSKKCQPNPCEFSAFILLLT
jgi:hypothetical protein